MQKYIPIMKSRMVELSISYENKNENIMPLIQVIKNRAKKNSISSISDDLLQKMQSEYFYEIMSSNEPGNIQIDIASFLKEMTDHKKYYDLLLDINKSKISYPVVPIKILGNWSAGNIKRIQRLCIKAESPQELLFADSYLNISFEYIFISFNPNDLQGNNQTIFSNIYNKYKDKMIFIFKNSEIDITNISAPPEGKKYDNPIRYSYDNYKDCFGFADYCMMKENDFPAQGGMISPGIKIQLNLRELLHVGDVITDIKDAQFKGYTQVVKNLEDNVNYLSNIHLYDKSKSYKLIKECWKTSNVHFITPVKAKYISMDHYIEMIKNAVLKTTNN